MDGIDFGTRLDFLEQGEDARRRLAEDAFGLAALGARREVPFPKGPEPQDVFGGGAGGGGGAEAPFAAWTVRENVVTAVGADGQETVAKRWQVWSPVWVTAAMEFLPGMGKGRWNDLPEGIAAADGAYIWAVLKVCVGAADYSLQVGGGKTALSILTDGEAGALTDTEVAPPQGTGGGTDGVYYIKVRIGGWEETATAAELAQGVSRLAFRQEQVGAIVEDWLPRRGAEEATLVTGLSAGTDGDGKPVLEVERRTFPLPPWLKTLETQTVTLPEGGGAIPEGTVFWGKVSVEAVTDGSSSSGGEVTGYRLRQEKWVWQDGGLVEAEGSPVEVGEIVFPEASGGGGSGVCVGPMVVEGETLRQYYGTVVDGAFVSSGTVAAEIPLYGHAEDHTEGVL